MYARLGFLTAALGCPEGRKPPCELTTFVYDKCVACHLEVLEAKYAAAIDGDLQAIATDAAKGVLTSAGGGVMS